MHVIDSTGGNFTMAYIALATTAHARSSWTVIARSGRPDCRPGRFRLGVHGSALTRSACLGASLDGRRQ